MSVQLKSIVAPEFDHDGYCITCGHMGALVPGVDLLCEQCPSPGLKGLFAKHIDVDATKLSDNWEEYSNLVHDKLMRNHFSGKRSGWDDPEWTTEQVKDAMINHIEKGDPIDIATFAMFWWFRKGVGND